MVDSDIIQNRISYIEDNLTKECIDDLQSFIKAIIAYI